MKAVFFDFDGTITYKSPNVWKRIWKECGYDTGAESYFAMLYRMFLSKQISHQEWCDLTCEKFKEADFDFDALNRISKEMKLIDGLEETLIKLKRNGFKLFIISGSIEAVIKSVLGDKVKYFDGIKANKLTFDESGIIDHIIGTNYDFEGKARFILEFIRATNADPKDLYFVGNSNNDEWANITGCHTICINPEDTDEKNSTKWHKNVGYTNSFSSVLDYILPDNTDEETL